MGTTRSVILSLVVTLGILVTPLAAHAQQAGKIPRVGVIANRAGYDAFREGLRDLAYKEGEKIALEFRSIEGRGVQLLDLATNPVRLGADVIVAATPPPVSPAKKAT